MSLQATEEVIELPYRFTAWPHQEEVFQAFYARGIRRFCNVWHRRSGKDYVWLNLIADQMAQRVGNYLHIFPQRNRARLALWEAIDNEGLRYIDHFPDALIYRKVENEMLISFVHPDDPSKEGSIYRCLGSDRDEHVIVGANPVGVVWSEYPEINPRMRTLVLPILRRNHGWEALCYTPRFGRKNHGCALYFQVKDNPDWFTTYLTIDATRGHDGQRLVSAEDVARDRQAGMSAEEVQQEYYLNWDSAEPGAYYATELRQLELDGRICALPYDPTLPTYTAWDLGHNDVNAIWWFQPAGNEVRFIDYEEASSVALCPDPSHSEIPSWITTVRAKPYTYDQSKLPQPLTRDSYEVHYGPHDLAVHEYSTGKTRYGHGLEYGFRFQMLPHPGPGGLLDGIETARRLLARSVFDTEKCAAGLDALRNYRRETNAKSQVASNQPLHNWASNGADAFRYAAVGLRGASEPLKEKAPAGSFDYWRQQTKRAQMGLPLRSYRARGEGNGKA